MSGILTFLSDRPILCPGGAPPDWKRSTRWALQPRQKIGQKMEAQTPIEQHATKRRPANYHSRLTSKPQRPAVSQRSALGKRLRDLADAFAERLGGWPALSVTAAGSVRRAAELQAMCEMARANVLNGVPTDMLALIRLEGVAARAIRQLGIKVEKPRGGDGGLTIARARWEEQRKAREATTAKNTEPPPDDRAA
jgi:hypothetical protein